jgi:signal transduction histidine kinase
VTLGSTLDAAGQQMHLSVQDDGPGIPADQLERLFDRFYRLEDSRSRDQGGAGLGLSIAKGIVDAHGGRIWLESDLGQGTTAHVQLPIGNVPVLDDEDVP